MHSQIDNADAWSEAEIKALVQCVHFHCDNRLNESTAGADASVEASYNVGSKKKPGLVAQRS